MEKVLKITQEEAKKALLDFPHEKESEYGQDSFYWDSIIKKWVIYIIGIRVNSWNYWNGKELIRLENPQEENLIAYVRVRNISNTLKDTNTTIIESNIKEDKKFPTVSIDKMSFNDSTYIKGNYVWKAKTLYDAAKLQDLEPFEIPLAALDLENLYFGVNSTTSFIFQCSRVRNCDISIPIMLDSDGAIADGYHRICRSVLDGHRTIKAYRLKTMPTPDEDNSNS